MFSRRGVLVYVHKQQQQQPLELVVPASDPLAQYMEDMSIRQTREKEEMKNIVMSAVKGQVEQQALAEQKKQQQQQQPSPHVLGRFIPVI